MITQGGVGGDTSDSDIEDSSDDDAEVRILSPLVLPTVFTAHAGWVSTITTTITTAHAHNPPPPP
jgi:hypothetical protein